MRRRVLVSILGLTVVSVVLFGVPLLFVFEQLQNEDASLRLEREAFAVSREVPVDFVSDPDRIVLPASSDGVEFGLYDRDGFLVAGDGPQRADDATAEALQNEIADVETPELRVAAVPIVTDQVVVGALRAAQSNVAGEARTGWILATIGLIAVLVIVVGAVVGYVVSGRLARPVLSLRDAAVKLGDGDFSVEIPGSKVAEIDEAAQAMTATAQRLDDLVRRERMFSSDVSHQLRTPVAGLRAAIETELRLPREDASEVLREALADLDRLEKTIDDLLAIARRSDEGETGLPLAEVLEEVQASWRKEFSRAGRGLSIVLPDSIPPLRASRSMLVHALDVLVDNALLHGGGSVVMKCDVGEDAVTISVSDQGPGFASMATPESMFSDETPGLGLPLARRLVESMGGRMSLRHGGPQPRIDIVLERADR